MHRKKYDSIIHMKEASPFYFHSSTISSFPNDTNTQQTTTNNTKFTAKKTVLTIFFLGCALQILCALYHIHHIALESLVCMSWKRPSAFSQKREKREKTRNTIVNNKARVSCTVQRNQQTQHAEMLLNYYKHTHKHIASVVFLLKFTKKIIRWM